MYANGLKSFAEGVTCDLFNFTCIHQTINPTPIVIDDPQKLYMYIIYYYVPFWFIS